MKASLKDLAADRPAPITHAQAAEPQRPSYRTAQTRENTRQLAGHFPADAVKAWHRVANEHDMDSQELMAQAMNMIFERYGEPARVEIISGRRKRRAA
jgi:hypothetical protein